MAAAPFSLAARAAASDVPVDDDLLGLWIMFLQPVAAVVKGARDANKFS